MKLCAQRHGALALSSVLLLSLACQLERRSAAEPAILAVRVAADAGSVDASSAAENPSPSDAGIGPISDGGSGLLPAPPPPLSLPGGTWMLPRGDLHRTGRSPFVLPDKRPQVVWKFATKGKVTAAPILSPDGTVVFGSHDYSIYGLHPDGTLRWKRATLDMVFSAPVVTPDGLVLVGSDDDKLYSLNLSDGSVRWTAAPGRCARSVGVGPEASRCDIEGVTPAPDGSLYVGGDGITALSTDGKVRWHYAVDKKHCGSSPSLGFDGSLYAVCQDLLISLRPDGSKRWEIALAIDLAEAPAIGPDGTAYLGAEDRRIYAVSKDGVIKFSVPTGAPVRAAVALRSDGTILAGSYDGQLYAVRSDGTLLWKFQTGDAIQSAPIIDRKGRVLFGSRDDRLYALTVDGQLLWQVPFDADVDGSPLLAEDEAILVGTDDRHLYALRSGGKSKID
ncbi:MAG TPA: PQQ-binding-like beta-propeller repeat protein [Pseudomonadota bacterium]|nr:PQQ-binding-like beta-propeller repeat protein [Pseudomonadota bacterium]HNK45595.1 PQQ-binding-like beta-propeller repeat protein [Pseudomonadota bacterium]HNN52280.1 PQQ-binding-like beta-propeller repeat protein [Pseudomonadota bacterium]